MKYIILKFNLISFISFEIIDLTAMTTIHLIFEVLVSAIKHKNEAIYANVF